VRIVRNDPLRCVRSPILKPSGVRVERWSVMVFVVAAALIAWACINLMQSVAQHPLH
jgi:hypothetical protein